MTVAPVHSIAVAGRSVNRIGFGAMRIMGARGADGAPSREAARALVRRAVELGVSLIDTADIYGDGASEEIIAEALSPYRADAPLIATKGGFVPGTLAAGQVALPADARPERLRRVCDQSLRRLRRDHIELYQLHTPDPAVPFAESVGALVELRQEGKIGHIGLSNVGRRHLATALELTPVASVQNRYHHADRASELVLAECEASAIPFLPWGPIGIDAGDVLEPIATELGATPAQVALAWLLHRSPVILPIPGTSSPAHLEDNVAALDLVLDASHLARLEARPGGSDGG
jgi:aryl-alcohol dehydrogenase-like predicted oxidoreductase